MSRPRITDRDVDGAKRALERAIASTVPLGCTVTLALHVGNAKYKATNKLVVTLTKNGMSFSRQLWPEGMAGYSKREAYNAMRIMTVAIRVGEGA